MTNLASQPAQGIPCLCFLSLELQSTEFTAGLSCLLGIYLGTGGPSSSPSTRTLRTELPPLPPMHLLMDVYAGCAGGSLLEHQGTSV